MYDTLTAIAADDVAPRSKLGAGGYGTTGTRYRLRFADRAGAQRWHRVYVTTYGNGGSLSMSHKVDAPIPHDVDMMLDMHHDGAVPMPEEDARLVAASWASSGAVGSVLATYATTGAADRADLLEDIRDTLAGVPDHLIHDRLELLRLMAHVLATPLR